MDITKIVSIALSSLIIIMLLRKMNNDYASAASVVLNISICVFSFGILVPVFDFLKSLGKDTALGDIYSLMFKSSGICLLCSLAAELCRDCGEGSLGTKIEFAGKCTLITFSLPLIQKVFENAATFIS